MCVEIENENRKKIEVDMQATGTASPAGAVRWSAASLEWLARALITALSSGAELIVLGPVGCRATGPNFQVPFGFCRVSVLSSPSVSCLGAQAGTGRKGAKRGSGGALSAPLAAQRRRSDRRLLASSHSIHQAR